MKAPGPDGYGSFFFKKAWNIVGDDLCKAGEEFFFSGKMLKQWNHTSIILIPKSKNASKVHEFRPISCCSTFYKIIQRFSIIGLQTNH